MPMNFVGLQTEVKRRATRDQGGTQFDTGIKNAINSALYRLAQESLWRCLRRKITFNTVTSYTKGTGAASITSGSPNVTVTGATFLTDGIQINRKVKFSGSSTYYYITQITGETTLVLDQNVAASSSTANTYEVLPQEEYSLPSEVTHRCFLWHEGFGYPYKMNYITDQDFYSRGAYLTIKYIPTHYRMWGEDMVISPLLAPSVISLASSSSADTSISITVFGQVSGYPDYEIIVTDPSNGSATVSGSKTFTSVERITKSSSSVGRITVTSNTAYNTVAVLPVGDTTAGILYRKTQLYPLPTTLFPIHVEYYKDVYRLVNDYDVHELGEQFDEAIILLATAKLKAEQNLNTEADRFFLFYKDELKTLIRTNVDKIDWFPSLRRPKQTSTDPFVASNLLYRQAGPYFGPATRF